jgi:GT2 family glycosyltransferase
VLVVGNDTVLPPWFYRELLSYDVPFVTGVAVDDMRMIETPPTQRMPLTENPDFSAFLIRKECWKQVGPFDERMKLYASDCDFHVRAHRLGVPLYKACVPYYHERSSTLKNAPAGEQQEIHIQANMDRQVFRQIYGCIPGQPAGIRSALFAQSRFDQTAPAPAGCGTDSETRTE